MNVKLLLPLLAALTLSVDSVLIAEEPQAANSQAAHEEAVRRQTAVALNYCRAALHRIRRSPEKRVLVEEQQRILNNLDLNQIEDPEVITLYKSILDEISQVEISERERRAIDEQFRTGVHRKLGTDFFVIGAQVATGQVGNVIQTGANSWWDYRNQEMRRDSDLWKVDKGTFTAVMSRSSTFLDSFWKLSRKNNIPDRWLVRDQDLDQLGRVLQERDAARRLRMLERTERFMECYPPYWYYLAKTQQELGQLDDAVRTYERLSAIGTGHFRQDDMLSSSMANMALIQEIHNDPRAATTAMRGLDYSTRNWESNLVCAWVLGRHEEYIAAEDLILCNLDERLEESQSSIALVSLYFHAEETAKLAGLLNDERIVRNVPIPGLLLCARLLGSDQIPSPMTAYLASTLTASVSRASSGETLTLATSPGWKINDANPQLLGMGTSSFRTIGFRPSQNAVLADFAVQTEEAELSAHETLRLTLNYPGTPTIHVTLEADPVDARGAPPALNSLRPPVLTNRLPAFSESRVTFEMQEVEVDGVRISLRTNETAGLPAEAEDATRQVSAQDATDRS
ncbi:MAG: hypothetical protein R3C19_13140 [Planctomycetaceae bacterium]